ncbi:unnamed protein product [Spirodela intermedia]|uniref:Protein phosphatase n=1 Tax=Spirodela intermedia TaxID=51605 RepID=A0A7I8JSG4_SPIIN|nr:unnamed protein product [Spirodela intermedia]CAA6672513.1 unnamed protein product [Spirodela intermedia]
MRIGGTDKDPEDAFDFWDAKWFGSALNGKPDESFSSSSFTEVETSGESGTAAPRWRLKLDMGSASRPKKRRKPLGEDAHFISEARNAFGVADGVGCWSKSGVDAGKFARQLMSSCKEELERAGSCRATGYVLRRVLKKALRKTTARGTSTACIGAVDGQLLRAVNIGDSGFMVVRGDAVAYRSPSQQHSFNFPFQIGRVDEGTPLKRAVELATELAPGDVIVAASDGLFDNLFEEEIVELVARKRADVFGGTAEEMARALAAAAEDAYRKGKETPFGVASRAAGPPGSAQDRRHHGRRREGTHAQGFRSYSLLPGSSRH